MTDTFAFAMEVGQTGQVTLRVRTTQFGDGYAQDIGDGLNVKAGSWPCVCQGTTTAIQAVTDFLDAHVGQTFFWTPPLGAQGYYLCKGYQPTPAEGPNIAVAFTLEQRFRP